jgi:magnesium transporter
MLKKIKKSQIIGLPPGTLIHVGEQKMDRVRITVIDYDEEHYEEKEIKSIEECFPFRDSPTVTWINIDGLHEADIIGRIGNHFYLHPLTLEDIVNTDQRPKIEDNDNYIFFIMKMLYNCIENKTEIEAEQISLVLGSNFVISFQEREGDVFDPVRDRIRKSKGRIRKAGADYLAYTLLDTVVDNYFSVLEAVNERVEEVEQSLVSNPTRETLKLIHGLKKDMVLLRKSVWPLREVISSFERYDSNIINKSTRVYLRDVYDHTIQIIDNIESSRDIITGMLDIYLSNMSNKTNEVMKVLTIFAAIFIPLTFIVGVYGMNFINMPELQWRYGYPVIWIVMISVTSCLIVFFKRRRWF